MNGPDTNMLRILTMLTVAASGQIAYSHAAQILCALCKDCSLAGDVRIWGSNGSAVYSRGDSRKDCSLTSLRVGVPCSLNRSIVLPTTDASATYDFEGEGVSLLSGFQT
ncbi:hypothetical protein AGOR_G00222420 [Albula goreensis]|uniref:Uncharacterized protein n=1 Tax=Albula goreensis TaxID=1534307 RepID=A0A8T3CKM0_9TELE|nr:hypothetical protein AGOR_G00222420 [Albula goreensis]